MERAILKPSLYLATFKILYYDMNILNIKDGFLPQRMSVQNLSLLKLKKQI